jgi:MoxR-like ATPase
MSAQRAPSAAGFDATAVRERLQVAAHAVGQVLWDHEGTVRLALAALLARGHILFEDVPGVGKTTLARALAKVLGCTFSRIQFTADMLPSDVLGVQVLDAGQLRFKKGPVFAEIVLADEINRASPKTQSAMLEAMGERKVTIDDATYALPGVFTVLATQNPLEHHGAYPLPESQLDRFMVRLALGYPGPAKERQLLLDPEGPERALMQLVPALGPEELAAAQRAVLAVRTSDAVADYALAVVHATRAHGEIALGASPRAAASLATMARAWALLDGRDFVLPDDVQALAAATLVHRVVLRAGQSPEAERRHATAILEEILRATPVPR